MNLARNRMLLFCLFVLSVFLVLGAAKPVLAAEIVVVQGDVVNLRSGPGTNYQITSKVTRGTRLELLGKSGDWYKIAYAGGKTSWIAGWLVRIENVTAGQPQAEPPSRGGASLGKQTAVVQGDVVNLRSGPGTNYQITSKVARGTRLEILGKSGDWYKVAYAGGKTSWIAGWLVKVENSSPPPAPPPQRGSGRPVFDLSVAADADKVVLQMQFVAPVSYRIFTLGNPDRLVIDFEGLPDGDLPQGGVLASSLVKSIRTGWYQRDPMIARITCDLILSRNSVRYRETAAGDGTALEVQLFAVDRVPGNKKVVLDPGHGGSDPGAIGPGGTREKDVNLGIALECARLLREQGYEVVLTRSADSYLDLYERANIANREEAAVFVSIHSNSNPDPSKQGASTYYYAPADDSTLALQAEQRARLAQCIQEALVASTGRPNLGLYQERFAVLRTSLMPSVLVEVAFLSNPDEERLLGQESFQKQAASGIAQGIINYFGGR